MAEETPESAAEAAVPAKPIDRLVAPLTRFLHVAAAGGVVLLACTVAALVLANTAPSQSFLDFWKTEVGIEIGPFEFRHSLKHLINDGLMAVFFFVIGLEVKRELVVGELRDPRRAALPIAAAIGGMAVPAGIYLALQSGQPAARGWGIPMATDIAFVVGCMAILGPRVPHGLRIMLLSLAIADDIGAILVIAVGYTEQIRVAWLAVGLAGITAVSGMARLGVRSFPAYTLLGVLVWFGFHESGVHATVAGVILGLMTPARRYVSERSFSEILGRAREVFEGRNWEQLPHRAERLRRFQRIARETVSPLEYLETTLHPWVSFVIMPIFALANAGVPIRLADIGDSTALAVGLGLVVGKPVGIVAFSVAAVRLGLARLPERVSWRMVLGGGCLAGIGFTMALFIAGLALEGELLDTAKIGVLGGSLLSASLGMFVLAVTVPRAAAADAGDAARGGADR